MFDPTLAQALVFDCDGTLVDSMPAHFLAWRRTIEPHGLALSEERFYALGGVSTREILRMLSEEQGIVLAIDEVARARDEAFLSVAHEVRPIVEVVEIATRWRGERPMAVATGGTRRQAEAGLRAIGVLDWFDAVVSADDVRRPKPAPDVFLEAARRIGVPASECLAYEDTDLGLAAASAAGMRTVDVRSLLR